MTKPSLPAKTPNDNNPPARTGQISLEQGYQATGSMNRSVQHRLLTQAFSLVQSERPEDQGSTMRAIYEGLKSIAPQDGMESRLAIQMMANHEAAMTCIHRAMAEGLSIELRDMYLTHAERMFVIFTRQMAALDKHRGKGEQNITVKRVTVESGGQAIVGNVSTDSKTKPANDEAAPALSDDSSGNELSREVLKPAKQAKQPVVRKRTRCDLPP